MTQRTVETFNISTTLMKRAVPLWIARRIERLGAGARTTRAELKKFCGTSHLANQFIDASTKLGLLVPTEWGHYEIPPAETLRALSRIPHPLHQRLVAWSAVLPRHFPRQVLFLGPRLWRDTELNALHPMPILQLDPDATRIQGAPPQWEAFHLDFEDHDRWQVVVDGDGIVEIGVPQSLDVALLLFAGLAYVDPRWRGVAEGFVDDLSRREAKALQSDLAAVGVWPAPRGQANLSIGLGPPYRRRLLVPRWYHDSVQRGLPSLHRLVGGEEGVRGRRVHA